MEVENDRDGIDSTDNGGVLTSKHKVNPLLRIATAIYCRSISLEFRRPVKCMYPNIMSDYLSVISTPMDLGTILLRCLTDLNSVTADNLRASLQLVFENAIEYNKESPPMEAMSAHIDQFTGGLFEEVLILPYRDSDAAWTNADKTAVSEQFRLTRLSRRRCRLLAVKDTLLDDQELELVTDALQSFVVELEQSSFSRNNSAGEAVLAAVRNAHAQASASLADVKEFLRLTYQRQVAKSTKEEAATDKVAVDGDEQQVNQPENEPEPIKPALPTLASLLAPVIHTVMRASKADAMSCAANYADETTAEMVAVKTNPWQCAMLTLCEDPLRNALPPATSRGSLLQPAQALNLTYALLPSLYDTQNDVQLREAMRLLDEKIGYVAVFVHERSLRGTVFSCLWARPLQVVWAHPVKQHSYRNPWWVVAVLAGGPGTKVDREVSDANLRRIPPSISRNLARKPGKSAGNLNMSTDEGMELVPLPQLAGEDAAISATSASSPMKKRKINITTEYSWTTAGAYIPLPRRLRGRGVLQHEVVPGADIAGTLVEPAPGQLLVEFLGTHEFYWVKEELTAPFFDPVVGKQLAPPGSKVSSESAIKEALIVDQWLRAREFLSDENLREQEPIVGAAVANSSKSKTSAAAATSAAGASLRDIAPPSLHALGQSLIPPPASTKKRTSIGSPLAAASSSSGLDKEKDRAPKESSKDKEKATGKSSSTASVFSKEKERERERDREREREKRGPEKTVFVEKGHILASRIRVPPEVAASKRGRAVARAKFLGAFYAWAKPVTPIEGLPDSSRALTQQFGHVRSRNVFLWDPALAVRAQQAAVQAAQAAQAAAAARLAATAASAAAAAAGAFVGSSDDHALGDPALLSVSFRFSGYETSQQIVSAGKLPQPSHRYRAPGNDQLDFSSLSCSLRRQRSQQSSVENEEDPDEDGEAAAKRQKLSTAEEEQGSNGNVNTGSGAVGLAVSGAVASLAAIVSHATTVLAGEGMIHTRTVDLSCEVFFCEHKHREIRKRVLRKELQDIEATLSKLQATSSGRVTSMKSDPQASEAADVAGVSASHVSAPVVGASATAAAAAVAAGRHGTALPGKVGLIAQLIAAKKQAAGPVGASTTMPNL